eukprot:scaffold3352_cov197-Chaetoceros_neogracile.AAC.5
MKLTRTILAASLYLLAPANTFGHREFSKASSHTIDTAGVKLSNPRTSGRVTKEAPAQRDFEITNNSDDTKEVLSIDSFKVMLQPTPSALTSEQISATIVTMKEILMVHFELGDEATELTLISGVDFNDGVVADFMPSKRMLRNGRSLVDGETTAAFSVMKMLGGYANVTHSVDIDAPSEAVLNESVRNILNQHLKDKLKLNIVGFENLFEVVVVVVTPEFPPDTPQHYPPPCCGGGGMLVIMSATFGSMAAICVAVRLGFYARKKGVTKKIGERYRGVKSSLRMHPRKRLEPHSQAEDSAVESDLELDISKDDKDQEEKELQPLQRDGQNSKLQVVVVKRRP